MSAGLIVAIALVVGLAVQALARHLRIPGIVLLLAAGALLGPDGTGLIDPDTLGAALEVLVGYAVAVILFEGGLNLNLSRLRRQAVTIRRLISVGGLMTVTGGAVLAHYVMGWEWRFAILFGSLVMVTGPTVITPLLRRTRVTHRLRTILEAEGVFIDAIGALTAIAAFELAFDWSGSSTVEGLQHFAISFGGGCLMGLAGGAVMAALVRWDRIVPQGLENVFILSLVLVLFQASNEMVEGSGIAAAAIAGVLVGNTPTRLRRELREFKEQLTVMLIGMLFVLLAAQVRLDDVWALGRPGVLTVLGLMFVVRPACVWVSTWGTELTWRDKAFLSWLAPRGIVAAAMASLFAQEIARHGGARGAELQALVFLVIGITVLLQGLLAGPVAQLLGVRRPNQGYVVLGANPLSFELAKVLRDDGGHEVVFIDNNASAIGHAEEGGFKALWGSGVDESILQRAEIDARLAAVGATPNEEINGIFATMSRNEFRVPHACAAMQKGRVSLKAERLRESGTAILYGAPADLDVWSLRFQRRRASTQSWRLENAGAGEDRWQPPADLSDAILPLAWSRRDKVAPFTDTVRLKEGRHVWFAVWQEKADAVRDWLKQAGWTPAAGEDTDER